MKLYRISPSKVLGDRADEDQNQEHRFEDEIKAVLDYLERWLSCIAEEVWTVSYKEVDGSSVPPESGIFQTHEVLDRLRRSFYGESFWILRGRSCRFVRAGQDFDILLCLKHDDALPGSENQAVEVENISSWLIETDFFDS